MKSLFVQYGILPSTALVTMLVCLQDGYTSNPLFASLTRTASLPVTLLITVKVCALLWGMYGWRNPQPVTLLRANTFYALCIAWNLLCLIFGSGVTLMRVGGLA
jgi:hypothetical protein